MGEDPLSGTPASTSMWDAADYVRHGGFVPALGQAALDLLDPKPGEHILDVGCGDGTLTLKIKEAGAEVVGIDNSLSMIAAARAKGLDARLMDAADLRFSEAFDAVFSNATLHWVLDKERAARAIWFALKAGGRFAGEMGGAGNLERLREALDDVLVARGFGPGIRRSRSSPASTRRWALPALTRASSSGRRRSSTGSPPGSLHSVPGGWTVPASRPRSASQLPRRSPTASAPIPRIMSASASL